MDRDTVRQIATISAFTMIIVVNALANILPINDLSTGEISDSFDVYFVPAGYVFSIWGVIYLALLGFTIYQALPSKKRDPVLRQIAPLFIVNAIFNSGWIFAWHYQQFAISLLLMLGILLTLIAIYRKLEIGRYKVSRSEALFVRLPFSLYLAWITVATVANVTVYLEWINWNGFGVSDQLWAVIMLVIAAAIGAAVSVRHGDWAFLLVLVWAFVGIAVKQSDVVIVAVTAGLMALLVLLSGFVDLRPRLSISSGD